MARMLRLTTGALSSAAARRPWITIAVWVILSIASVILISQYLGDSLTHEVTFTRAPESQKGQELLEEKLTGPEKVQEMVIVRSEEYTVDDDAFKAKIDSLTNSLMALGADVVEGGFSYYQTSDPTLVSADRHATLMPVVMAGDLSQAQQNVDRFREVMEREAEGSSFTILSAGEASAGKDMNTLAEEDLQKAEMFGIPIAMVILVIVFGTLVAGGLPLILAAFSIVVAMGITAALSTTFDLSMFIVNMITMMGMAVGIDYSLFVVSRYREELAIGRDKFDAIRVAASTASRAVLFSGITVILALAGMLIVPSSLFYSLAVGAIIVVTASVVAALTLLPAVLSLIGGRINSLKIPVLSRFSSHSADTGGGFWNWITKIVMKQPAVSALLAATLLIVPATQYLDINTGANGVDAMPESFQSRKGFEALERDFSFGLVAPVKVVINGNTATPGVSAAINRLVEKVEADDAFYGEPQLTQNEEGDLALLTLPVNGDDSSDEATEAVSRLREDYIPAAFEDTGTEVLVTGNPAINLDYFNMTDDSVIPVFAFVLGLSFLLLLIVFRSIVVPLKAIIMNLLSVGAAYGLIVMVFQKGWGASLFGFKQVESVEAWVPLFLFSVLFGLSMDYHVFLLSRIRERFLTTGDNTESVAFGLRSTGSIITGAALIMVVVFGGFAAGQQVMFQQMGFGLAIAVLIDATIVRSILVPSTMKLLGRRNWYLPKWLNWIPEFSLEEEVTVESSAGDDGDNTGGAAKPLPENA